MRTVNGLRIIFSNLSYLGLVDVVALYLLGLVKVAGWGFIAVVSVL